MKGRRALLVMLLLAASAVCSATSSTDNMLQAPPVPQPHRGYSADVLAHDPAIAQQGDTWYLFVTGPGITVYSSKNLKTWKAEPPVFASTPAWARDVVPDFNGHIWAPDISSHNGIYTLYYAISAGGKNTSAIGVATNTTLDTSSPQFKWVDHGILIRSLPQRDMWNAIDPNLITDVDGTPWMVFGSFWGGLKLVRLSEDRMHLAEPQQWYTLAKRERSVLLDDADPGPAALEGPFLFHKNGWFYLFMSWDYCCRGMRSNYHIMVGRSRDLKGPYLDKDGKRLDQGGGSEVLHGTSRWAGPGGNGAYTFNGKDYLVFHAYDGKDGGLPKLHILPLTWDAQGWPVVDQHALER